MASIKYKDVDGNWVPLPTVVALKGLSGLPSLTDPAQPSDVAKGKQYINQNGVATTGTYEKYTLPSLTNPATAAQVVEGADFVNKSGARQVGTMPVVDSIEGVKITSIAKGSSGQITASGSAFTAASTSQAVYPNTDIEVPISLSGFGNATAADVMRGKTFTSSSGYVVTGTKEDSSGGGGIELPALSNPADSAHVAADYDFIDDSGRRQVGEMQELTLDNVEWEVYPIDETGHGDQIKIKGLMMPFSGPVYAESDTDVDIPLTLEDFGDATSEDVREGVTFTSSNGYQLTGTMTNAGGGGGSGSEGTTHTFYFGTVTTTTYCTANVYAMSDLEPTPRKVGSVTDAIKASKFLMIVSSAISNYLNSTSYRYTCTNTLTRPATIPAAAVTEQTVSTYAGSTSRASHLIKIFVINVSSITSTATEHTIRVNPNVSRSSGGGGEIMDPEPDPEDQFPSDP